MMKLSLILCLLGLTLFNAGYSQKATEETKYSQSVVLDTSVVPDYFNAEITIGEYYQFNGKGRKRNAEKVSLDTVKQLLVSAMQQINFNAPFNLVKVSERDGSYKDRPTFQATYAFNIYSKDSIDLIYRHLTQTMPAYSVTRFNVGPALTSEKIKQCQVALEKTALARVQLDAEKFADSNKLAVKKIDTYQVSFIRKERYDPEYYNGQQKAYQLSFANPVYSLSVYYVFLLR